MSDFRLMIGDVFEQLALLDDESVDCCVTSPPYWGQRDYGYEGQIGMEPTLGEHLDVMVKLFREIRRVLTPMGTLWINYGDCYAATPNGRSAAAVKAAGNDDRTFRDKPFSTIGPIRKENLGNTAGDGVRKKTIGPIHAPLAEFEPSDQSSRRGRAGGLKNEGGGGINGAGIPDGRVVGGRLVKDYAKTVRGVTKSDGDMPQRVEQSARVVAGGYLKPKDLCMIPNRLAIALQDDGWWVRAENVWAKPNPMPDSSGKYRPSTAHEKVWMLTKSAKSHYDALAVKMPVSGRTNSRVAIPRAPHAGLDLEMDEESSPPQRQNPKAAPANSGIRANESFQAATTAVVTDRYLRNCEPDLSPIVPLDVWSIPTAAYAEAHFATFPPALVVPCVLAGCPVGGTVLDPFGGTGTTALVARRLGRNAILIEMSPEYAEMADRRVRNGDIGMGFE